MGERVEWSERKLGDNERFMKNCVDFFTCQNNMVYI